MISVEKIEEIVNDIVGVLGSTTEQEWAKRIKNWRSRWLGAKSELEKINLARNMMSYFRGAGSINDLVFYRNGEIMFSENKKFDELRSALFDELSKTITGI